MEQVNTIIRDFLNYKKFSCPSPQTIKFYKGYLERFFKFTNINIQDLGDTHKFREAYMQIYDRQISQETKIKYLKSISLFCDFLVEEGIITNNPARKHPKPKKVQKTTRETFDRKEIIDIFFYLDEYYHDFHYLQDIYDRNRLIVFLLLFSGVRRSELVNIQIHHFRKDHIFIEGGKGNKDRIVAIPQWLSEMIQRFISKYKLQNFLFVNKYGEKIAPNTINKIFRNITQNTGIDTYAHKFRHTYATNCLDNNIPLNVVQSQLGHASITTTAIYIHCRADQQKREISKIPNSYYFC